MPLLVCGVRRIWLEQHNNSNNENLDLQITSQSEFNCKKNLNKKNSKINNLMWVIGAELD